MTIFLMRIILIEHYSTGGFPLKYAHEHCFLSIKVLFWCCSFIYCVVLLLLSVIFLFSAIIIDMVPYKSTLQFTLFLMLKLLKMWQYVIPKIK
jgi:hypothetical protein